MIFYITLLKNIRRNESNLKLIYGLDNLILHWYVEQNQFSYARRSKTILGLLMCMQLKLHAI